MNCVKMVKQPLPPGAMPDLCASACIHVHQSATSLNSLTGDVNINDLFYCTAFCWETLVVDIYSNGFCLPTA